MGDKKEQLRCFLKRIDSGCAWARGRKKGKDEAHACLTEKVCFDSHVVIDFRHAAWLFGWLKGYSEAGGHDAIKKYYHGRSRPGSGVGRTAGDYYIRLLYKKGWLNDTGVRKLLDIKVK